MDRNHETSVSSSAAYGFDMARALVVLGFVAATVILRIVAHMSIRDIVVLLSAGGAIAVAVLVSASVRLRNRRLVQRFLQAALNNGAGS
ncbi:hypothetical protein [Streptomyces lancefieldiae]|uniref:Uncharacterized protein n=1 Tax=Streptomyces lancefieldiae TaxID=3075520 RepID=A0ABU3AT14_9ACTN|nr:hypothetical protein [Streptomyces sp. DSM 40712]MDT0612737.1 hypothetical protein [Streptomyces sp. DSM 40712]